MGKVPVSQLKNGLRLSEDVTTHLGNVLLQQNVLLTDREIEILHAFQIKYVTVQNNSSEEVGETEDLTSASSHHSQHENSQLKVTSSLDELYAEYNGMFDLLKKAFKNVYSPVEIPVIQIRTKLERLIKHINEYSVLTFTPPRSKMEDNLYHNSIKVSLTSYLLAKWSGLPSRDLIPVAMGGLFHDIGNMRIDPKILNKPSGLTRDEIAAMQQHTVEGYNILKDIAGLNEGIKLTALQHHEREDGSGYPLGIKGDQIHQYAKIVSVADIFHAMTSKRIYKQSYSPYVVLEQLHKESFGKLDPSLVLTFINKATRFNHGTVVKLNDGRIGEIVFTEVNYPTRPWVKVDQDIINLVTERHLSIQEVIRR